MRHVRIACRLGRAAALAVLLAASDAAAQSPGRYVVRVADGNRVGLTVSNYGFIGNNFVSRAPSFEFPLGSGYEHMARAGLWVGAVGLDDEGAFTGVSSAIVDNSQGSGGPSETEFTPVGDVISERSQLANSDAYSPDAISDQDLIAAFTDVFPRAASGYQSQRHRPLKLDVRQTSLAFTLPAAQDFTVLRYSVVNRGAPLRQVWLALYVQLVSGDKNAYSTWPPSSSGGPRSWYYSTYFDYDSTRLLYKERFCLSLPFPDACLASYVPPWVGVKVLRTQAASTLERRTNFRWWSYAPGDASRDEDSERYALMSTPLVQPIAGCTPGTGDCSPIALVSVGPFDPVASGDSLVVDFAMVGGDDHERLLANADYAQFAADIDYELPSAPPSPRVFVETGQRRIDVWWDDSPESVSDPTSPAPGGIDFEGYRLYLGRDRLAPELVAQVDRVDTTGFNTGLGGVTADTPRVVDGVSYRYHRRIEGLKDGFTYYGAVTSYDLGDAATPSLESGRSQNLFAAVPSPAPGESRQGVVVFPNPYRVEAQWDAGRPTRDRWLWFAGLPRRCTIRIYALSGDRVFETQFDGDVYRGENARGLYRPDRDLATGAPRLSGASFAWDLITTRGQAAASGLYLWAVEDRDSGEITRGRFLVIKSDRD